VSKFRLNSLSIVYHCAEHNLPTLIVKAMNRRAARITNGGREGQMQGEFNEPVLWTRNATSENIAIFNVDRIGNTHHKHPVFPSVPSAL